MCIRDSLRADPARLDLMQAIVNQLDPADLETLGYPLDSLWRPLEEADGKPITAKKQGLTRYGLQRKLIVGGRGLARKNRLLRALLRKLQMTCDVLLRE